MPRVSRPSDADILKHGREFAILKQVDPSLGDGFEDEVLDQFARYGNKEKVKALFGKDEVPFQDFVNAFKQSRSVEMGEDVNCIGWAARDESGKMSPWAFKRRECRPDDVHLQITYAGMCHSDIHQLKSEWGKASYPMVPGHEIMGVVTQVGKTVTKVKVGDVAAIGCMVGSCRHCKSCAADQEQYCLNGLVGTYNAKHPDGEPTYGGYSSHIVCTEHFVLKVDPKLHVPGGAPLLCAGITVYSPMKHYGADKPGQRVGVVGLGGLGHMAVKFAKNFGQHVTVLSRSDGKKQDAFALLGADSYLISKDENAMKEAAGTFDVIIDTVSAKHDVNQLLSLLTIDGKLICVGAPAEPHAISAFGILMKRIMIGGSLIGGIRETQEMLDFCAQNDILSMAEVIPIDYVNEAVERMEKGDVKFRFVIDTLGSLVQ